LTRPKTKASRRPHNGVLLHDTARAWATIKHKIDDLVLSLKIIGRKLRRQMRRHRATSVATGKDLIQLIIQRQKDPGKRDILGFFGEARGEEFWTSLPDRISEYLTFARPKADRAGQRR